MSTEASITYSIKTNEFNEAKWSKISPFSYSKL